MIGRGSSTTDADATLMAYHRAATVVAIAPIMATAIVPRVLVAAVSAIVAMVTLVVPPAVMVATLRVRGARGADGRGHHADGGEDHADFHSLSFDDQRPGRVSHYAGDTTSFLTNVRQGAVSPGLSASRGPCRPVDA